MTEGYVRKKRGGGRILLHSTRLETILHYAFFSFSPFFFLKQIAMSGKVYIIFTEAICNKKR